MVRRLAAVMLGVGALALLAAAAFAAERPGGRSWTVAGFGDEQIDAIDVGPDGRIVVAGSSTYRVGPARHTWVRAYRPDGTLDPAFGEDGVVVFGDDPRAVEAALVQPDGRILIAEGSGNSYPPRGGIIRRLIPDGRPDATFGAGGQIESYASALALQSDGRIVAAGGGVNAPIVITRYLPDGSLDTAFGGGRRELWAGTESEAAMSLQPNGGIVLTARRKSDALIGRLTPVGDLDATFGAGGLAPVQYGRPEWAERVEPDYFGVPVLVLPDGGIRIPLAFAGARRPAYRTAVFGLTSQGHPDRRFGRMGLAAAPYSSPAAEDVRGGETPEAAVADGRGGVLVASVTWSERNDFREQGHSVIRRFGADGIPDRSFGTDGAVHLESPRTSYTAIDLGLALLDQERLVVAEHAWDGKYGFDEDSKLRLLNATYDEERPLIGVRAGCRRIRVRVRDMSALDALVVRSGGRVIRRTRSKRLRFRTPRGVRRLRIQATDVAGNSKRVTTRLPRC